jgi:peptide deformylase
MILKIRQVGELVLRQKSHPLSVEEISSQYVRHLIESMRETMHDAPGVGLAAPQIGIPLELVVIEDTPEAIQRLSPEQAVERERQPVPFQVLINPILTMPEGAAEFFEGCLSLPGYTAIVPRAKRSTWKPLTSTRSRWSSTLQVGMPESCSMRSIILAAFFTSTG